MPTARRRISKKDGQLWFPWSIKHLKKSKGHPYQLRVTIDQGPKFVGKRVTIPIGTRDPNEATRIRDLVLEALDKGGFLTKDAAVRLDYGSKYN